MSYETYDKPINRMPEIITKDEVLTDLVKVVLGLYDQVDRAVSAREALERLRTFDAYTSGSQGATR